MQTAFCKPFWWIFANVKSIVGIWTLWEKELDSFQHQIGYNSLVYLRQHSNYFKGRNGVRQCHLNFFLFCGCSNHVHCYSRLITFVLIVQSLKLFALNDDAPFLVFYVFFTVNVKRSWWVLQTYLLWHRESSLYGGHTQFSLCQ